MRIRQEFVKLKDVVQKDIPYTRNENGECVRLTGTIVLSSPGRWPWSPRVETERQVWSSVQGGFGFLRWRHNGAWIPNHLSKAAEMAAAFDEVEYAP